MILKSLIVGTVLLSSATATALLLPDLDITFERVGFVTDRNLDDGNFLLGGTGTLVLNSALLDALRGNTANLRMGMPVRVGGTTILGIQLYHRVEIVPVDDARSAQGGNSQLPPVENIADTGIDVSIEEGAIQALIPARLPLP